MNKEIRVVWKITANNQIWEVSASYDSALEQNAAFVSYQLAEWNNDLAIPVAYNDRGKILIPWHAVQTITYQVGG